MKIIREKRNRKAFIANKVDQIVTQLVKSLGTNAESPSPLRKGPQNICYETGKTRTVIKGYRVSRHIYRKYTDTGQIEGNRRGT
ncbi:MAG: hypothetical protein JSS34_08660 [Proteobacteria bacterium]|nr:hypothetical protein [Pseudomonadota bacterium]